MSYRYRICLIEDHETLGKLIQQELQHAGYECSWYTQWSETIFKKHFDCFILDVMLPEVDGFTIGKMLREECDAGIIYLTAKVQLQDKHTGFELGADDYLTKPFVMKELLLRINAILQRIPQQSVTISTGVSINITKRIVVSNNTTIHCTPIERHVLTELIQNYGLPCSRTALIEAGWGEDDLFSISRSLDVTISHLRSKLGKSSITTIPKVGYMLK